MTLRGLIALLLAGGIALLAAPFLHSSLALDERGINISGRVFSKSETVVLHYSDWKRTAEVTFRYEPPDTSGVTFFGVSMTPERYDAFHVGDSVTLRYLLPRDIPAVPLSNFLRQLHALPIVRLAGRRTFTSLEELFTPKTSLALIAIATLVVLLFMLRTAGSRLFGWVLGISLAAGVALLLVYDFPRPTPKPATNLRLASGKVKSLSRIDSIFASSRSRGFIADQPVDVVGIEFIPEGSTESVVAVDLIDAGSVSGLKTRSTVPIRYEANSPRTAWIQSATRNFVSRDLFGMVCRLSSASRF